MHLLRRMQLPLTSWIAVSVQLEPVSCDNGTRLFTLSIANLIVLRCSPCVICRRLTGCSTDNNGICAVGDLEFQQFFQFIVIHLSIFIHRG